MDGYPSWHPDVIRDVSVLERDENGLAKQVQATLRVAVGPLKGDYELVMAITRPAGGGVVLERLPNDPADRELFQVSWWFAAAGDEHTAIRLEIDGQLDVPRLAPLHGLGDRLASGFVQALCRALGAGTGE
jgi:ribosome-associated toxin RatA of RatAB toxin-antitoxin module